jgi:CIC family chloride channel protein
MTTEVQTVSGGMTLHQAAAFLTHPDTRHPSFPVTDDAGRVLGIIDPPAVLRWRRSGQHRSNTLAGLLAGTRPVVAYPDEYLDDMVERMNQANVAHISVVSREDGRLAGYIGWKDLMNVRARLQAEERERVVLYRVR